MLKTILVLPDGREISSGPGQNPAVRSCAYTQSVNTGRELAPGGVCAAMVELKLWALPGSVTVSAGDRLTIYKENQGSRRKLGVFIAQKPERPSKNLLQITAYDPVILLEQDVTDFVEQRTWPCTLLTLAREVCARCGLELVSTDLPNGDFPVQAFGARGITGRQILGWIGQAAGRFCRATAEGKIEFAWYVPAPRAVDCTGAGNRRVAAAWHDGALCLTGSAMTVQQQAGTLTLESSSISARQSQQTLELTLHSGSADIFCYQGGAQRADYRVEPVDNVQIRADTTDMGVAWPGSGSNTYRITGNPLLTGGKDILQSLARNLYNQLHPVTYTPCTLSVPANTDLAAGQILSVTDAAGECFTAYIMERRQSGQRDTLICTGSRCRDDAAAVSDRSLTTTYGRVLHLQTDLDGIRAENKDAAGRAASLVLDVDGIRGQVSAQSTELGTLRQDVSTVRQEAGQLRIDVQTLRDTGASKVKTGASYTFDDDGLRIAKTGEQMENKLDNTGMYVTRSAEMLLSANADGVRATDVQVSNYLILGSYARFEDISGGRTGCFYIGG